MGMPRVGMVKKANPMSILIVVMALSVAIEDAYVLAGGLKKAAKQEEALQRVKANHSMLKNK